MRKLFGGIGAFLRTPSGVILVTTLVWHAVLWAAKIPFNPIVSVVLLVIDFAIDVWDKVSAGQGRLDRFVSPRMLQPEE